MQISPGLRQPAPASRRTAALGCLAMTTAAYMILYGFANQWTSARTDVGLGVFAWERAIPFIGWTIVPYLSIFVFFVLAFFVDRERHELWRLVVRLKLLLLGSVLCYAALPLRFTFERPETQGVIGLLFDVLTRVDLPYNRAPSLHIGVLTILWVHLVPAVKGPWRLALQGWFLLIALSVLTTYQHHVLDVPAGAALGALVIAVTARSGTVWPRSMRKALQRRRPLQPIAMQEPQRRFTPP